MTKKFTKNMEKSVRIFQKNTGITMKYPTLQNQDLSANIIWVIGSIRQLLVLGFLLLNTVKKMENIFAKIIVPHFHDIIKILSSFMKNSPRSKKISKSFYLAYEQLVL